LKKGSVFSGYLGANFPFSCAAENRQSEDLPKIISLARSLGFTHIQVNSNGLRLAEEPALARRLLEAGLPSYTEFDGIDDAPTSPPQGGLFEIKKKALENCAKAGLAVVLVPVLVRT
jgi:uncharacterized radical SAM superfamily Fe-S cluster-containing enzyme